MPINGKKFVAIAASLSFPKILHYQVPENLQSKVTLGKRALVPLGKRKITGYILNFLEEPASEATRPICDILDEEPLFGKKLLKFFFWISDYYFFPLGEVIKTALPKGINSEIQQIIRVTLKGKELLNSYPGDSLKLKFLKEANDHKKISFKRILQKFRGDQIYLLYRSMQKEGLIEIDWKEKGAKIRPKKEKFICLEANKFPRGHLSEIELLKKRAPKQARILEFIVGKNKVSSQKLQIEFPNPSSSLQALLSKGFVFLKEEEVYRESVPDDDNEIRDASPPITQAQERGLAQVIKGIHSKKFLPYLLHETGDNTRREIYFRATQEAIRTGREAIILVPEISMASRMLARFRPHFGDKIAIFHSGLASGERYDTWRRIKKGKVKIVIGARSAIFAPFENLGVIIVENEQDLSYKQEEKFRYHARNLALMRGKMTDSAVILGSATPSIESFFNAGKGKLIYLKIIKGKEDKKSLPLVRIVDMRKEKIFPGKERPIFSRPLKEAIKKRLAKKEKILLFINRRGLYNFVICQTCGFVFKCPHCDVSLSCHLKENFLICHYCGFSVPAYHICPRCRKHTLEFALPGTERLEEEIKNIFPLARVARIDRDTVNQGKTRKENKKKILSEGFDILIGTQMIAGVDHSPRVTLVGIIMADQSLNIPDFRAGETTFHLLTRIANKTGRENDSGEVIIQTFNPNHYSIKAAKFFDFFSFFQQEMAFRKELNYPPFSRLVNFTMEGKNKKMVEEYATIMGNIGKDIRADSEDYQKRIEILGPATAPLGKVKGRYRLQMLIKGEKQDLLHNYVNQLLEKLPSSLKRKGIKLGVDVDPVNIL